LGRHKLAFRFGTGDRKSLPKLRLNDRMTHSDRILVARRLLEWLRRRRSATVA
jgi:hypothetical protein